MASQQPERRKTLVVNARLQGRLVLRMTWLPAVALAAIAIFTGLYCSRLMSQALETDTDLPGLVPLFYFVIIFELVAALLLMVNSLKVSHRVAGPAYRICKSLERIRSGDLAFSVQLRKGDHLGEIRDELNKLLDWLNANPPPGCVTRAAAAAATPDATSAVPTDAAPPAAVPAGAPPPANAPRTD